MSTEPRARCSFHKLNTMQMRAFALATTNLQGRQYHIAAGFGSDDFGYGNVDVEADRANYLLFHLIIVPESCFATRIMHLRGSATGSGLDLRYPVFGDPLNLFERTKHLEYDESSDTAVVRACVNHLRASVGSDEPVLANHVAYFVDPTDTPRDLADPPFLERIKSWTAEVEMNMRLLPAAEVKYTLLDGGRVRFEFGRLLDSSELRYAC